MNKILLTLFVLFCLSSVSYAQQGTTATSFGQDKCLWFEEEDGNPKNVICAKMKVSNDSLTNNGNGSFSLDIDGSSITSTGWTVDSVNSDVTLYTDYEAYNVGIGTNNPSQKLDIKDGTDTVVLIDAVPTGIGGCDTNALFLTHLDGVDGNNSFVDEDCNGDGALTLTVSGAIAFDDAQVKFGDTSAVADGSTDEIIINTGTEEDTFLVGTNDFTYDGWFRLRNSLTNQGLFGYIFNTDNSFGAYVDSTNVVFYNREAGANTIALNGSHGISLGEWFHLAVERDGNVFTIYINGSSVATTTDTSSLFITSGGSFRIGRSYISAYQYLDGWVDEFRFSNIARYSGNFTPEIGAYTLSTPKPSIHFSANGSTKWKIQSDGANSNSFSIVDAIDNEIDISLYQDGKMYFNNFDCSGNANSGALTVDAFGRVQCSDDDGGAGGGGDFNDTEGYMPVLSGGLFEDSAIYSDASTTGNVGIGVANPVSKLQVGTDVSANDITIGRGGPSQSGINWLRSGVVDSQIYVDSTENLNFVNKFTGGDIIFKTQDAEVARIDSAGNFGIADTSPDAMLEIAETGTTPFMISNGASGDGAHFIVNSDGNVGIGQSNPTIPLEVVGSSFPIFRAKRTVSLTNDVRSAFSVALESTSGNPGAGFGPGFILQSWDNTGNYNNTGAIYGIHESFVDSVNGAGSGGLRFAVFDNSISPTPVIDISSTGNVGIGTVSPLSDGLATNAKLSVYTNTNDGTGMVLKNDNTGIDAEFRFTVVNNQDDYFAFTLPGSNNSATNSYFGLDKNDTSAIFMNGVTDTDKKIAIGTINAGDFILGTSNTERMRITSAGNVGIGDTSPGSSLSVGNLPSGTTDAAVAGSLVGALCITDANNIYIDTNGTCAN